MSVMVFYKPISEHARVVEDYLHDFLRRTAINLETIDPDTARGADLCRLYDIVEYPTIVATGIDGRMKNSWRGVPLPTIDEVSYYVR
jgi:hypothetical protein